MELRPVSEYCTESILSTTSNMVMDYVLEEVVMGCKDGQDFPPMRGTWKSLSCLDGRGIPMAGTMLV